MCKESWNIFFLSSTLSNNSLLWRVFWEVNIGSGYSKTETLAFSLLYCFFSVLRKYTWQYLISEISKFPVSQILLNCDLFKNTPGSFIIQFFSTCHFFVCLFLVKNQVIYTSFSKLFHSCIVNGKINKYRINFSGTFWILYIKGCISVLISPLQITIFWFLYFLGRYYYRNYCFSFICHVSIIWVMEGGRVFFTSSLY